jgi:hypothetical protein
MTSLLALFVPSFVPNVPSMGLVPIGVSSELGLPILKRAKLNTCGMLARLEGLEPPAYRFEVCRSIQLSYRRT